MYNPTLIQAIKRMVDRWEEDCHDLQERNTKLLQENIVLKQQLAQLQQDYDKVIRVAQ